MDIFCEFYKCSTTTDIQSIYVFCFYNCLFVYVLYVVVFINFMLMCNVFHVFKVVLAIY